MKVLFRNAEMYLDGMMKKSPMCTAVRTGLVAGVELSNAFTGMDEIAYHGKMMAGYGHLAKIAFEIMRLKGEALIWDSTYENALLYDMAFNICQQGIDQGVELVETDAEDGSRLEACDGSDYS